MLYNLLDKLFIGSYQQACQQLLQQYQKEKNLTVHFLYFANIILNNIHDESQHPKQKNIYYCALQHADFLLPDGIALYCLRQAARWKKLIKPSHTNRSNLNGTDFTVRFLLFLKKKYQCRIVCYGSTDEIVQKAAAFLQQKKITISSTHNGYQELDRSKVPSSTDNTITILLVGRGSPLQEIRTYHHQQCIRDKKILALTVG
jgi:UDP-N-acetyl-D-mannosaminuronic acid transferase (WecB/TagA/CpsF family)